jgi:ATP-dependent RNA helicase RhlE
MSFINLGLNKKLSEALEAAKLINTTPIQEQAIPLIIDDKDILGIAQTGSGKTLSYVLPILQKQNLARPSKNRHVNALILVPTRELAKQVEDVFLQFNSNIKNSKTLAVFGGVSINPQMIGLQGVEILVATPGRLIELVQSKAVSLSQIDMLVLDEADKMLSFGFTDEMDQIFSMLPAKRQNLLFSATLNKGVSRLKKLLLNDPQTIKIEAPETDIDLIQQIAYDVDEERKGPFLRYLIKSQDMQQVLIFVSSQQRADNVANKLRNNGIEAWPIHSKKSQGARTDLLTKFKNGKLRVLVATDLISRGIDIEFLPVVINYELPRSPKDYIHRIGRTGRAENPGTAISLVPPKDEPHFYVIQKKMGKRIKLEETTSIDLKGY